MILNLPENLMMLSWSLLVDQTIGTIRRTGVYTVDVR